MEFSRREATPIEIAALLMDAVCTPEEREQTALGELAAHLQIDLDQMQSELLFLRAFAVDFATAMALGQAPERQAILERYYLHWEQIDQEAGGGLLTDLQARLQLYTETVGSHERTPAGLKGLVGRTFARCCERDEVEEELTVLGGEMFGALFEEVVDLLQEVDIALNALGEENGDGS